MQRYDQGKALHTIMHLFRPVILPFALPDEHAADSFVKGESLHASIVFGRSQGSKAAAFGRNKLTEQ